MKQAPCISIRGAREHNLKELSLDIPRDRFVVITGVSGSGKSTLAFDLLYAEGQRRFLDSMSAYARQFVQPLAKPDVDLIAGLPPVVSIEQRNSRGGGKSTVATVTEIHHFVRLLYAKLGVLNCPKCQAPVQEQSREEIAKRLFAEAQTRGDLRLLAPIIQNRKGFHQDIAKWAAKQGFREIRVDGKMASSDTPLNLDRYREHSLEVVIGVLEPSGCTHRPSSVTECIDRALTLGKGVLFAMDRREQVTIHSTARCCPSCLQSFEPLEPKMFSYNSSRGWCPRCRGFGELFYLPDVERGANADSIEESWFQWQEGKREICPECQGARLNPLARSVHLQLGSPAEPGGRHQSNAPATRQGLSLEALGLMPVTEAMAYFNPIELQGLKKQIAEESLREIRERLKFLSSVGLGYLQLGRGIPTLSSGEAQRIRLAAQLGSNLSGVLYILDEPTIGLHARDNDRLLETLSALRSRGNSLVVVEHDEATIRAADYVIDLGPGAGVNGGRVVAAGTIEELRKQADSLTGKFLNTLKSFPARGARRPVKLGAAKSGSTLILKNAVRNNLKKVKAEFPLRRFTVVTGVSGSGKSTLVRECLLPLLQAKIGKTETANPEGMDLAGWESIRAVYEVDQAPIGRTPRSIPATYIGFFDIIRKLYAQTPEARLRGYGPGRFSFNSAEGRCPACEGAGAIKVEMNFLPSAYTKCETCEGTRFNQETLDIEFHGKNIAQVLELSVAEALEFFGAFSRIRHPLEALHDTGMDYIRLGQTSPTLSGGEAQRLKLVTHLLSGIKRTGGDDARPGRKEAASPSFLFILEEPTIGLHSVDVARLIDVIQRLVDAGHTVIAIEHNLDFIAEADWILDLGPEGGAAGGQIVASGTPESVAGNSSSHTGNYLNALLASGHGASQRTDRQP